jgi:hypothetical protein
MLTKRWLRYGLPAYQYPFKGMFSIFPSTYFMTIKLKMRTYFFKNAESMYSHLNVLVNDINALGVKNITDLNINHKILQSLWKPDYNLVEAIIYEKKIEELKPSQILSKVMAHELQIMPKSRRRPK